MFTLCLGGPMDGQVTDQVGPYFFVQRPVSGDVLQQAIYRRETFAWAGQWSMWVYLYETKNPDDALAELFGGALPQRDSHG